MRRIGLHISSMLAGLRNPALALCAALLLLSATPAFGAPAKWETPKTERVDVKTVIKDSETEIKVARGVILIQSTRPTQVKVYTILGQLVSRETLPAGQSQLSLSTHGVYIIKTPELTCKVAL